jgi:hypothetical protein
MHWHIKHPAMGFASPFFTLPFAAASGAQKRLGGPGNSPMQASQQNLKGTQ